MSQKEYRIRNWEKFQHYKDRSPPWIRLHKNLLDDYDFHCLPVASRALAPMLWLLASEHDDHMSGLIVGSDEKLAFRLRMKVAEFREAIKSLITNGFVELVQDASNLLARCEHDATPETDRTEAEAEKPPTPLLPDWIEIAVWDGFKEMRRGLRSPMTQKAEQLIFTELNKLKAQGHDPTAVLEQSIRNNWKDVYKLKEERNANTGFGNKSNRQPTKDERARAAVHAALADFGHPSERGG